MADEYEADDNRPEDSNDSGANPETPGSSIWDSVDAVESIKMEKSVNPEETNEQMTKRLLEEAAPLAAARIIHIALHDTNSNTSLRAAQFITDKLYAEEGSTKQSWEDLIGDTVVKEAEALTKASSGPSTSSDEG